MNTQHWVTATTGRQELFYKIIRDFSRSKELSL